MISENMKNAGLKLVYLFYAIFVVFGDVHAEGEISNSEVCRKENLFVGINFSKSEYIGFPTEPEERKDWNMIMLNAIRRITKKPYFLTCADLLERYRDCPGAVVKCLLDSYSETSEDDGEITGNITLTFQFFKRIRDSLPEKIRTINVSGGSDDGHIDPLENAIDDACSELRSENENLQFL